MLCAIARWLLTQIVPDDALRLWCGPIRRIPDPPRAAWRCVCPACVGEDFTSTDLR